ncbi:MAG: hypothetical protein VXZ96_20490 [Myxococcota bacterium]|nr:hypothetical protein [Myxococcota bacterium]MEC8382718.1 hypothetical protein [Myxococcota bacterium]
MEETFKTYIEELKGASISRQDEICEALLSIGKENPSEAADLLRGLTKFEHLNIQWLVEEVIEQLAPTEDEPEEVDDPTTRPLRSSELELVYDDPRGVRLYRSTVDTRWVLYQVDPRSGMPMQQELQSEEAEHVKRQLYGSPYWLIPMEQPQATAAPEDADLEMIYSDPNGIRIYETKSTGEWVLVRPDPMTGSPTPQKLTDVMRQSIKLQLGDSPYWTNADASKQNES